MFKLYGYPRSRSTRVLWTLEEAGAPYEYVLVNLQKGEQRQPKYLSLNPVGKVPTLVDGDFVLTESGAICTYIGERAPEFRLVPASLTRERAEYDRWLFFVIGELEQPLWTLAKHTFALPESLRVPAIMPTAKKEFRRAAAALATALGDREFVVGNGFTAADIIITHTLLWARGFEVPLEFANLEAYADRHSARPGLARAQEREHSAAAAADA